MYWIGVKDGDDRARALFNRHYSKYHYKDNRHPLLFCGPGGKMVLITMMCDALFVWRRFIENGCTEPKGINCAVFRNEGGVLSSKLIAEADELAFSRWPGEKHYTYVNADKIRSTNPGNCFIKAGWTRLNERTKGGLVILEKEIGL